MFSQAENFIRIASRGGGGRRGQQSPSEKRTKILGTQASATATALWEFAGEQRRWVGSLVLKKKELVKSKWWGFLPGVAQGGFFSDSPHGSH